MTENIKNTTFTFHYEDTVAWDCVYDVVVIGFGGAGAPAAAAAADAGAKVLLTEKAPLGMEGGNARVAGQHLLSFTDYEKGCTYMKSCRLGLDRATPDEYVEQYVRESMKFEKWWNDLGYTEYETHQRNDFPFPGGESAICYYTDCPGTQRYWQGVRQMVLDRAENIDVWYEAPACGLIQDPFSKTVLGVRVKTDGQIVNVRAIDGVVMALGGFEDNTDMLQNYGNIPYPAADGGTNTGDGINMAIEVGARLGRMASISGPYATFVDPKNNRFMFHLSRFRKHIKGIMTGRASVVVGPDGTRFYDETTDLQHGDCYYHGNYRKLAWPVPCYLILDSDALENELHTGWGKGNKIGIEKGYLHVGKSAEELAEKIGVDPTGLANTLARWNEFCRKGNDEDYGRTDSLDPFSGNGYCALLITPSRYNTTGGPDRTLECEVISTSGELIPHLYGCGDLGGYGIGNYHGGYGLMEAWYTGMIAGKNAAVKKASVPLTTISIAEKKAVAFSKSNKDTTIDVALAQDEYLGSGEGMYGPITVKVRYTDKVIRDIEVVHHKEDEPIGGVAMKALTKAVIAANSVQVDAISSATLSSNGFLDAVKQAIEKADKE